MNENWPDWLRAASFRLGLTPKAFWALTVLEWRILVAGGDRSGAALSRAELGQLLDAFPHIETPGRKDDDV